LSICVPRVVGEVITKLADTADVLIESNRPGVMERHGIGPEVLCARNSRLVSSVSERRLIGQPDAPLVNSSR
jgi:hypothetical protein